MEILAYKYPKKMRTYTRFFYTPRFYLIEKICKSCGSKRGKAEHNRKVNYYLELKTGKIKSAALRQPILSDS